MESSFKGQGKKKVTEVKIFPVPFPLDENQENIIINTSSKYSKEQIINHAFKFHSQGNIQEAIKYYQHFINKGFKDHRVFSNYGVILRNLGKSEEAELFHRRAIKIKPNFAVANYNLGNILNDIGKLDEAELSARKAIELKPDYAEAHYNLGVILVELNKFCDAINHYKKAIKFNNELSIAKSCLIECNKY